MIDVKLDHFRIILRVLVVVVAPFVVVLKIVDRASEIGEIAAQYVVFSPFFHSRLQVNESIRGGDEVSERENEGEF